MQFDQLKRRSFLASLAGAAAWPVVARAQQPDRVRRIGVLLSTAETDPESVPRIAAFEQELQKLGWTRGRDINIDYRFGAGDISQIRMQAAELVALAPDVIVASGFPSVAALQPVTRSVPVVFLLVTDPVGAGFVESLARPGGNVTGFAPYEFSMAGKWWELEIYIRMIAVAGQCIFEDQHLQNTLDAIQSVTGGPIIPIWFSSI